MKENSTKTLKHWNQNRSIEKRIREKHIQDKTITSSIGSQLEEIELDLVANVTQQNYVLNMQHKNERM